MWYIWDYNNCLEECSNIDITIIRINFKQTLGRLISRNLVVTTEDKVTLTSIYKLIENLTIIPSTASFQINLVAFFKLILIDRLPVNKTKETHFTKSLTIKEKFLLKLIKKYSLRTYTLIFILQLNDLKNVQVTLRDIEKSMIVLYESKKSPDDEKLS